MSDNEISKRYVALLRGVNAGGKRRVPKLEFQQVLESLGFSDVEIYINSGNAVFSSVVVPRAGDVQAALEKHFGFDISTLILNGEKIRAIAAAIPSTWTNDALNPEKTGRKSDVVYLFDDVNKPESVEMIGHLPEIESLRYIDGAILATISRRNQARGSLAKITTKPIYKRVTIRNITTAKKLAELVERAGDSK